tara:strand:+ start:51 stop:539 length:489 start_codon:yes stop_codon:yes gene_type:complete
MKYYEEYKVNIPEGQSGDFKIQKFIVNKKDAFSFNISNMFQRSIEPGTYTKLVATNRLIMSDTPAEISDHLEIIYQAKGNVLINGLGIGMVVIVCARKKEVKKIIVNEISEDVIKLVAPFLKFKKKYRLTILMLLTINQMELDSTQYGMTFGMKSVKIIMMR